MLKLSTRINKGDIIDLANTYPRLSYLEINKLDIVEKKIRKNEKEKTMERIKQIRKRWENAGSKGLITMKPDEVLAHVLRSMICIESELEKDGVIE